RFLLLKGEALGHFEQHGHSAGIVVRSGKELAVEFAEVVKMSAEDDPFILELGVGPGQDCRNIAADETALAQPLIRQEPGNRLKIRSAKGGRELEAVKGIADMLRRAGGARPLATQEFRTREAVDMGS